jgi:di/tricarboxylate transporter
MLAQDGDFVILAIQRRGEELDGLVRLEAGDHLLVQGAWDALDRRGTTPGVLMVDKPGEVKRQLVVLGPGARTMLVIAGLMVALIASGAAAPAFAALLAAGATLALRIVTPERAFREINWTTVILMAGMFPLSTALTETGAADLVAGQLVALTGSGEPRLLLAGIFVLGVGLGIVISNTATCLILIPIVVGAAEAFGVSALPALMTLSVATSASFLTPVSTPVNTMVMGPAGYRFGDYWPLGLPLTLVYGAVAVWLVPLIWPL